MVQYRDIVTADHLQELIYSLSNSGYSDNLE